MSKYIFQYFKTTLNDKIVYFVVSLTKQINLKSLCILFLTGVFIQYGTRSKCKSCGNSFMVMVRVVLKVEG